MAYISISTFLFARLKDFFYEIRIQTFKWTSINNMIVSETLCHITYFFLLSWFITGFCSWPLYKIFFFVIYSNYIQQICLHVSVNIYWSQSNRDLFQITWCLFLFHLLCFCSSYDIVYLMVSWFQQYKYFHVTWCLLLFFSYAFDVCIYLHLVTRSYVKSLKMCIYC